MVLLRTSYRYGGILEFYFKQQSSEFGVYMVKITLSGGLQLLTKLNNQTTEQPEVNFVMSKC